MNLNPLQSRRFPLFLIGAFRRKTQTIVVQKDVGSSPVLDQFFCAGFFRLCETFFANFFNVSKGSTLHFFSILHKNGRSKPPKGPFLQFFGTMRLTGDQKISKNIQKNWIFLNFSSRGYCRREYLTL